MNPNTWEEGLKEELRFWRGWLGGKGKHYEKPNRLVDLFTPMIGDKKEVRIANLGAGPVCLIGDRRRDINVSVESSDILADDYQELLDNLNIKLANPVKKQDVTKLTYEDESFDIVYCANALDHCQDPYSAVCEMVRICKPGGWIYIYHIAHEGQRNNYRNLHKWNLDMTEDGDCIFWNNKKGPKTDTFLLSEIYSGFTTTLRPGRRATLITSIVQKK